MYNLCVELYGNLTEMTCICVYYATLFMSLLSSSVQNNVSPCHPELHTEKSLLCEWDVTYLLLKLKVVAV